MKFRKIYILLLCLWCIATTASAQWDDDYVIESNSEYYKVQENEGLNDYSEYHDNPVVINELDEARWEELQEELTYPRGTIKKEEKEAEKEYKPRNSSNDEAWAGILKFLLIGFAIAVIALVLFKFLEGDALLAPRNRRVKDTDFNLGLDEIEANIHDLELQDYIQNAVENKDHRLAIRLYYLDIIKGLSNAKLIKWKRDKTNGEYVAELHGNALQNDFQEVTLYFERVWYGNTEISKKDFDQISPYFKSFLNTLPNK